MHRKSADRAGEAGADPHHPGLTFPVWYRIPSASTDTSPRTQDAAVTPGETEAKGLICWNVSPDLPNSHNYLLPPPCLSRDTTSPQSPLPSLAGTSAATKPSILPQLPHEPGTSSFASSCPVCPVKVRPCVLLIVFPTKCGFPAGIRSPQPHGSSQRPAVPALGTFPCLQTWGV